MHPVKRALPAVWLVAAIPVGILGYLAFAVSDAASDRRLGLIVAGLARCRDPHRRPVARSVGLAVVRASLFASLLWALAAGFATVSVDSGSDRLLLGGLPAAVAVITGMLALQHLRVRR